MEGTRKKTGKTVPRFSALLGTAIGAILAAGFVLLFVPWGGGCGAGTGGDSDTDVDTDTDTDVECHVDDSQPDSTAPAWELKSGSDGITGYICPPIDKDYYWFTVASPGTIVELKIQTGVRLGGVDYCYRITRQGNDESVLGAACDYAEDHQNQGTLIDDKYYARQAGTYFVEIYDEGKDEEDTRTPYQVSLVLAQDPDKYEPNDSKEEAKAVVPGQKGYISYNSDSDWFKLDATAGEIVIIDLSTQAATPVDLRYTLIEPDGKTVVNTGGNFDGTKGPTKLHDVLPLYKTGTYYLVVKDEGNDDVDLEQGYVLTLSKRQDPDQNEENNGWSKATSIQSGSPVSAYLATRGDEDWYRISAPGVTDTNPGIIQVDLKYNGSSPVQPAVDLIVADPRSSCEQGDACEYLEWNCSGCEGDKDCLDAECPSHECDQNKGKCRGASICLPDGCALRHLTLQGKEWSETGDPRHLHTVAPMYGNLYYVLVRDFQAEKMDPDTSYTLTVTTMQEPDKYEFPPNGIYLPYATNDQEAATIQLNKKLAKSITCRETDPAHLETSEIVCDTIEGYLSFRGDQDWYVMKMEGGGDFPPKDQKPDQDCDKFVDWDLSFEWSFNGNPDLQIYYTAFLGGTRRGTVGFCATPGSRSVEGACFKNTAGGVFGDDECVYFCGETDSARPFYFRVMHYDRKKYDYKNPYRVTIRAKRQCPLACSGCKADCAEMCCPNENQPNPPYWCGN
ncbi:MAG: hypothetical protein GXP49_12165 [Deltaproteobacteria bacterium]|nr:hypothetical protein [Deltaproteobacteria bacterium]